MQERELAGQLDGDLSDAGAVQRDVDRLEPLSERIHDPIDALDHLLERSSQGRVGICDRCGRPIEIARLRAVPDTPFCAACRKEIERFATRGEGPPPD
jgi:RNA polymerase-binding transcription factor DksA